MQEKKTKQENAEKFLQLIWDGEYLKANRLLCYTIIDVGSEYDIACDYERVMGKKVNYSTLYNLTLSLDKMFRNSKKVVKGNTKTLSELLKYANVKYGAEISFPAPTNIKEFVLFTFWKGETVALLNGLFMLSPKGIVKNDSYFANVKVGNVCLDTTGKLCRFMAENISPNFALPIAQTLRNACINGKENISLTTLYSLIQTVRFIEEGK